jgi:hypothetical protein
LSLSFPAHANESPGCTPTNTGLGATVGGLIGVIVLPGIGFFVGAALGGGGTCLWKQMTGGSVQPLAAIPAG